MGMCKPSGGINTVFGKIGDLKALGLPNSRVDLYDSETGELLQQRWYDSNGKAVLNRDWKHSNKGTKHIFPHDHHWDWSKTIPRGKYIDGNLDPNFE